MSATRSRTKARTSAQSSSGARTASWPTRSSKRSGDSVRARPRSIGGARTIVRFLVAKVLYVNMRRVGRGYYSVHLSTIAEPPYDEVEDVQIVERYARNLERDIRESPWDWLWLQKKWKIKRPTVSAEPTAKPAAAP